MVAEDQEIWDSFLDAYKAAQEFGEKLSDLLIWTIDYLEYEGKTKVADQLRAQFKGICNGEN